MTVVNLNKEESKIVGLNINDGIAANYTVGVKLELVPIGQIEIKG